MEFSKVGRLFCFGLFHFPSYAIAGPYQGFLGIQGEGSFIFRELGSTSKYFKGSGEQAGI